MAYNNQYAGYGFSPYQSDRQNDAFNRDKFRNASKYRNEPGSNFGRYSAAPVKKHSGCKGGIDKKGRSYVSGWKYSKRSGLVSLFAAPYKGTSTHKSENGRTWENWIVKLQNKSTMTETIMPCLFDRSTGKVIIQKLGFVMNPKGGKGGYVGTYINQ
jgi:hypothetical protein